MRPDDKRNSSVIVRDNIDLIVAAVFAIESPCDRGVAQRSKFNVACPEAFNVILVEVLSDVKEGVKNLLQLHNVGRFFDNCDFKKTVIEKKVTERQKSCNRRRICYHTVYEVVLDYISVVFNTHAVGLDACKLEHTAEYISGMTK